MKQNIYDDPKFFAGYSQLRRHESGLNMAVDQPAMRSLLPPLTNKHVLDLGCGFGKMCLYAIEQGADANGNLTSDGTNTYTWDARNHLSAISGAAPGSFAYVYDALNRRVSKSVAGNTTQFLYDGLNPVQELQSGSASANLLTGLNIDEYFQRTDSAGTRDLLTDALGSTWGLADSSGTLQTRVQLPAVRVRDAVGHNEHQPVSIHRAGERQRRRPVRGRPVLQSGTVLQPGVAEVYESGSARVCGRRPQSLRLCLRRSGEPS